VEKPLAKVIRESMGVGLGNHTSWSQGRHPEAD